VTRIGEIGTTLVLTSNRRTRRRNTMLLLILFFPWLWRRYVPTKRRFLEEPHGVASQNTAFFKSPLDESVVDDAYISSNSASKIALLFKYPAFLVLLRYKSFA
jgi:hypothetical protein